MKEVKAFQCDFCPRCFIRKCNAVQHEPYCKNNPKTHYCITCIHSAYKEFDIDNMDNPHGPFCEEHDMPIHEQPYFLNCEINDPDYGSENPVPNTCFDWGYKGYAGWKRKELTNGR